ncbi:MAG: DUF1566 domain-containing protein [candidate division Zixibacteria bacterium]|nr:DUF1566 domain-containing protein [candidate division Zixibacteria bacterium]
MADDYPIVDTGQDQCFNDNVAITCPAVGDPFYGQDAQYDGYQPNYTLSDDGLTVYDNITGLTWIRTPDTDGDEDLDTYDQLTWSEFLAYPATLNSQNYGGYDDWRVPSIKELYSLMDFRGLDPSGPNPTNLVPFIDTIYFDFVYGDTTVGERIIDAQYWSSTQYVGTVFNGEIAIFGVNVADGRIKGYPRDIGPGGVSVHYARYVRGNMAYATNDFVNNGDATITDNATGLMWSQDDRGNGVDNGPHSGIIWQDALAWVQQKNDENYLGYSDWRLPNAKEMQSIVDYSRAPDATGSAAIDPIFNITEITNERGQADYPAFWTGTTHANANGGGSSAAYVCFGRAMGYFGPPGMEAWVDVHGAGAQRSDPKSGDPDDWPYGHGPQGDAIRIYNYVRLVRDAELSGDTYNYLPGDANMSNGSWPPQVIGGDVTYLVNYFRGIEVNVPCLLDGFWASADANGDCLVIGSDVTKLVSYFRGITELSYCPDYPPTWSTPDDLPVDAPDGWPNCE